MRLELATTALGLLLNAQGPVPYSLHYERSRGAELCVDQRALESEVSARLGHSSFVAEATHSVHLKVEKLETGFRAVLFLRGPAPEPKGRRELTSASNDCGPLMSAVTLALAILMDPSYLTRPPANQALPPPKEVRQPPGPPSGPPGVEPTPSPQTWVLKLGAGLHGGWGTPDFAAGGSLGVSGARGRFRMDLTGRVDWPQRKSVGYGRLTVGSAMGQLSPCLTWASFAGCAALTAGALQVSSEGLMTETSNTAPWFSTGGRMTWDHPLHPLVSIRAEVGAEAQWFHTMVTVDDQPVWRTPPLYLSAGAHILIRML